MSDLDFATGGDADDFSEDSFRDSARRHAARHPAASAPSTVWIDATPEWMPAADWLHSMHYLTAPPSDTLQHWQSRWRFHLPGGHAIDTLNITLESQWGPKLWPSARPEWMYASIKSVTVTINNERGLKRSYVGSILDATDACEMQQYCVTGLSLEVGERVAAFVRQVNASVASSAFCPVLIDSAAPEEKAEFLSVIRPHFAERSRCFNCRRVLRDEVSKALGIGPDCAARAGIAHTQAAAHCALQRLESEAAKEAT